MTIDELCVKVSVVADEADAILDALTQKLLALMKLSGIKLDVDMDVSKAGAAMERVQTLQNGLTGAFDTTAAKLDEACGSVDGYGEALRRLEAERTLAEILREGMTVDFDGLDGGQEAADAYASVIAEAIGSVCADPAVADAIVSLREISGMVLAGITPNEEQTQAFLDGWALLSGEESPLTALFSVLEGSAEETVACVEALLGSLTGAGEGFALLGEGGGAFAGTMEDVRCSLESAGEAAANADKQYGQYGDAIQRLQNDCSDLNRKVGNVASIKKNIDAFKDARKAYDDAKKSGKGVEDAFGRVATAASKLDVKLDKGSGSVKDMDKAMKTADKSVDALAKGMTADAGVIVSALQNVLSRAQVAEDELNIQASMGVDVSQPLAAIRAVIAIINALLSLMGRAGIAPKGGGGGGGGGKRDSGGDDGRSAEDEAEEAARKAEEARKEAIERDYDMIAHKRHMQEINLEQELVMLEQLRRAHQLNAEEIMEWEEKVYDLKQEIRERDAQSIDTLADGVVSALENRYEAMRDAEIERLDTSREAWEQWRDDSVRAIEDQIAALDELSATEDREAKDAEELRSIEKLRREIAYEQDEYNRMKLEQQLQKALDSREERLRKLALQEQKEALRDEIDRIGDRTDEQLSALDREQEGIEAAYEERLKEAAINAEAEKLLLTKNQDEIMNLLGEYVPEYNALGQSMGEKLVDGFQSRVGDVVNWFKSFNEGIVAMQERLAAVSSAAADGFYQRYAGRQDANGSAGAVGVTVNQTVQFYEPVESPSQVARRMEDVNDALGEMLG